MRFTTVRTCACRDSKPTIRGGVAWWIESEMWASSSTCKDDWTERVLAIDAIVLLIELESPSIMALSYAISRLDTLCEVMFLLCRMFWPPWGMLEKGARVGEAVSEAGRALFCQRKFMR